MSFTVEAIRAVLEYCETITDQENPFCIDGRKKKVTDKNETVITRHQMLTTRVEELQNNPKLSILTANELIKGLTLILKEIPEKIIKKLIKTDERGFLLLYTEFKIRSEFQGKKNADKKRQEEDNFNKDYTAAMENIAGNRKTFLEQVATGSLQAAQKTALGNATAEIVVTMGTAAAAASAKVCH